MTSRMTGRSAPPRACTRSVGCDQDQALTTSPGDVPVEPKALAQPATSPAVVCSATWPQCPTHLGIGATVGRCRPAAPSAAAVGVDIGCAWRRKHRSDERSPIASRRPQVRSRRCATRREPGRPRRLRRVGSAAGGRRPGLGGSEGRATELVTSTRSGSQRGARPPPRTLGTGNPSSSLGPRRGRPCRICPRGSRGSATGSAAIIERAKEIGAGCQRPTSLAYRRSRRSCCGICGSRRPEAARCSRCSAFWVPSSARVPAGRGAERISATTTTSPRRHFGRTLVTRKALSTSAGRPGIIPLDGKRSYIVRGKGIEASECARTARAADVARGKARALS